MVHLFLFFLMTAASQLPAGAAASEPPAKLDRNGSQVDSKGREDNVEVSAKTLGHDEDIDIAHTSDFTITVGVPVTPNRQATDTNTVWNQESRIGPSAGLTFRKWLSIHNGLFGEVDYSNTNTRLADYDVDTWTMNRVTVDGGYSYRWLLGRFTPYVKVGCGAMVFISGTALNNTSAGLDDRMEGLAGSGIDYRIRCRISPKLEYEGRLIRNPNFSDITWKPQRNWISEPKLGITYTFGQSNQFAVK